MKIGKVSIPSSQCLKDKNWFMYDFRTILIHKAQKVLVFVLAIIITTSSSNSSTGGGSNSSHSSGGDSGSSGGSSNSTNGGGGSISVYQSSTTW